MPARAVAETREGAGAARPLTAPPLVTRALRVRYGPVEALAGLDLRVRAGAIVGLVGPNGSGKTTALRAIAGLAPACAGEAAVAGAPAGTLAARRALALVADEPGGVEELTVEEYVALVRALHAGGAEAERRAGLLLGAFGLDARRRVQLRALSRGLRRQASMVAALALAPPLLLLDEATAALDPEAVVVLREALGALARHGVAVLLATQDLHFAETACDEVVLLRRGTTVAAGPIGEVLAAYGSGSLEEAFVDALLGPGLRARVRDGLGAL